MLSIEFWIENEILINHFEKTHQTYFELNENYRNYTIIYYYISLTFFTCIKNYRNYNIFSF